MLIIPYFFPQRVFIIILSYHIVSSSSIVCSVTTTFLSFVRSPLYIYACEVDLVTWIINIHNAITRTTQQQMVNVHGVEVYISVIV